MPEAGEAAEEEDVADPGFQSLLEGTGLDLRFSLFSLGQEDFSLGLDHWMARSLDGAGANFSRRRAPPEYYKLLIIS